MQSRYEAAGSKEIRRSREKSKSAMFLFANLLLPRKRARPWRQKGWVYPNATPCSGLTFTTQSLTELLLLQQEDEPLPEEARDSL